MTIGWVFAYLFAVSVAFPGILSDDSSQIFSKASCDFAIELLKAQSKQTEGNVVLSPNSVGILLAVLQQGAKENTLKQIETALHMTAEQSKLGHSTALKSLQREKTNVTLEWGTRAYIKPGFELHDGFNTTIRENFGADIQELNFVEPSTVDAAKAMNEWIREVTHDNIKNLVSPGALTNDTILVLLNAIYFKGYWDVPFSPLLTMEDNFYKNAESDVKVKYMRQKERLYAGEDPESGFQWVNLMYKDSQFSMLLLLPSEKHGLGKAFETLNGEHLLRIINNGGTKQVTLQIPKFKLEEKVELSQPLKELGVTDIFGGETNLQGITPNGNLRVSSAIQQANVEVDEQGTTAAAATGFYTQLLSLPKLDDQLIFTADHPFLFFLLDIKNNVPLFAGKIVDPS